MRSILLSTLFLVSALTGAEDLRQINCRFLSFGGNGELASAIALSGKGEEIICPLSETRISSKVVCFAKNNAISFLSATDRKPLATATIPAGVNSALLVFVRNSSGADAKSPPAWRVFIIDDDKKNFPKGGAYIVNFYNKDIRFIIGEHKGMLQPAGAHGYAMPTERDTFNMAAVVFEFLQGEKWRPASESALRFLPGIRYLMIAFVDPISGRPSVKTYQDLTLPSPQTPTP